MRVPPKVVFWLMFIATVGQGLTSGAADLTGIVPAAMASTVDHWIELIDFIVMTFLTLATGAVGPGVGPLAKPPTVDEAQKIMDHAKEAEK